MTPILPFPDLQALAAYLRQELGTKKFVLLYGYNGTGKTRLSMEFRQIGKQGEGEEAVRDTLYFNAFTEDLFHWDNDLDGDSDRKLTLNASSHFFDGLAELEMDNRIRPLLQRYADFDFRIDTDEFAVRFSRTVGINTIDNIKVSRGEENIFIWCFFLAIVELARDGAEAYQWVKYVYIDDPISSLDEQNAVAVATHLTQLLKSSATLKSVISTHHPLFFNVLCNGLNNPHQYIVSKYFVNTYSEGVGYRLEKTGDTPFFHHVAALGELYRAAQEDRLFTYHFNMLRTIMEKTANFHGHKDFSACIRQGADDPDGVLHTRLLNILSHGRYSLYEPQQMLDENKTYFKRILDDFLDRYQFNPILFPQPDENADTP